MTELRYVIKDISLCQSAESCHRHYLSTIKNNIFLFLSNFIFRYYRSGMEMARMAQIYQTEGNFENAFILYIKFTTLFLEKIPSHPEYKIYDAATKRQNKEKLKEIFPIAERLKAKLLERFQHEYENYLEAEQQRKIEREKVAARIEREQVKTTTIVCQNFNYQCDVCLIFRNSD